MLHDVDATIPDAALTTIVGPSGGGKSTLLRLCNRLVVPSAGRVRFRGRDLADLDVLGTRRRIGMVFQVPTLFAGTVRDNLAVAAPDAGKAAWRAALTEAELDPSFLDRDADQLSGGEAQRACLARTLSPDRMSCWPTSRPHRSTSPPRTPSNASRADSSTAASRCSGSPTTPSGRGGWPSGPWSSSAGTVVSSGTSEATGDAVADGGSPATRGDAWGQE